MKTISDIIDDIIKAEGGYSDNRNDLGGKTMYGITESVARASGYSGDMRDLPLDTAKKIYFQQYVAAPGFDRVMKLSPVIAAELVDTGVNMGPSTAGKFLQRSLNAFNNNGSLWPDVVVDGGIGDKSISALESYLKAKASQGGERVLLFTLNSLQCVRYIELSEARKENESFAYGWIHNRVESQLH